MKLESTSLPGVHILQPEVFNDLRGSFIRAFSQTEFAGLGLKSSFVECNVSLNSHKGTLRGLHYQSFPYAQVKLVRCERGSIFDVVIDIRPDSSTYCDWLSVELNADNHQMLYVPEGFAHGFQTLESNTEVLYMMGELYAPSHVGGIRWDDPVFGIDWPLTDPILSDRDRTLPDFSS